MNMSANCLGEKTNLMVMKRQKRREKSRDAARCRRHKESDTFEEICDAIPIPHEILTHLDKSAIMRLLISYIKLRQVMNGRDTSALQKVVKQEVAPENTYLSDGDFVNALNGFLLILSSDLDVLFVSDNVKEYLGLSKFELMGQSVLAYTHEGDHDDLKDCFDQNKGLKSFFLRLKTTLTVNGKSINLKSASYKVVRCSGVLCSGAEGDSSYLVAHAEPLPHPANIEHLLDSMTFVSQHSPDMKFTYCDERFSQLLGYNESDLLDHSFFDFCHVADMKPLGDSFHKLYRLNQVETNQYRFLAKTGGYYWILTQATVVSNQKSHKPQCVVCVHYVISGLEQRGRPLSLEQLKNCCAEATLFDQVLNKVEEVTEEADEAETCEAIPFSPDMSALEDDDCNFAPLTITELEDTDRFLSEDLCYNAPSIGDPWTYSEGTTNSMDEIFTDTLLDEQPGVSPLAAPPPSYNPPMIKDFPLIISKPEPTFSPNHPWGTDPSTVPTPLGSLSPCDSAYGGSPMHCQDSGSAYPHGPSSVYAKPPSIPSHRCPSNQGGQVEAWQSVEVSSDQYARHMSNLKRGRIDMERADMTRMESEMKQSEFAKRRCVDPSNAMPPANLYKAVPQNSGKKFENWNVMKNAAMLFQPGGAIGCKGDDPLLASNINAMFLLQPELNLKGEPGQRMIRNLSSGFLPELSVRDCEVNAPLVVGQDNIPLATDCVHLLDHEA